MHLQRLCICNDYAFAMICSVSCSRATIMHLQRLCICNDYAFATIMQLQRLCICNDYAFAMICNDLQLCICNAVACNENHCTLLFHFASRRGVAAHQPPDTTPIDLKSLQMHNRPRTAATEVVGCQTTISMQRAPRGKLSTGRCKRVLPPGPQRGTKREPCSPEPDREKN